MCWIHWSEKDELRWYLQKLYKWHDEYNTTKWSELKSKIKELAILKKEEIKETDTYEIQIEDYSDSIWMILNLNVN